MSAERTSIANASQVIYSCDVPRCLERYGHVHSPDLWTLGVTTAREGLPEGWTDFAVSDENHHAITRVTLCPEHAHLAKHRELLELISVITSIQMRTESTPTS